MENLRYSDKELEKFKKIILEKLAIAEYDLKFIGENLSNDKNNGTNDTSPSFKFMEEGANTSSKESNAILASRQEKFIRDLKNALIRIENKTYGICKVTGKLINPERLKIVPHTTSSIDAKKKQL